MKNVLVLGAGLVARPMIDYLLHHGYGVTIASRTVSKAEALVGDDPNGKALEWTVDDLDALRELVAGHDLVVSLIPPRYHVQVAEVCLDLKKNLVTTSYVSDEMRALHDDAVASGLVFLNEVGLDPGIDHMSAMRIINDVEERGGTVVSFRSMTGALPAFEANTNPFGYKFSWAPKGVLLASKNSSRWLQDGEIRSYPGHELFENYGIIDVPGVGAFENYPNRDSLPYKDIYGLTGAETVYRGTLRITGWCETMRRIVALGWLSEDPVDGFTGGTYADLSRHLVDAAPEAELSQATAEFLGIPAYSTVIKRLEWLGLWSDRELPSTRQTPLDYLHEVTLEKMALGSDERDMIVMHHEFEAEVGGKLESITSTLVDYGVVGGDTAIARTVSLPAAIAVRMILEETIDIPGVHVPVTPDIYDPILDELAAAGIEFVERSRVP